VRLAKPLGDGQFRNFGVLDLAGETFMPYNIGVAQARATCGRARGSEIRYHVQELNSQAPNTCMQYGVMADMLGVRSA